MATVKHVRGRAAESLEGGFSRVERDEQARSGALGIPGGEKHLAV